MASQKRGNLEHFQGVNVLSIWQFASLPEVHAAVTPAFVAGSLSLSYVSLALTVDST
jgi:hypothetical protein